MKEVRSYRFITFLRLFPVGLLPVIVLWAGCHAPTSVEDEPAVTLAPADRLLITPADFQFRMDTDVWIEVTVTNRDGAALEGVVVAFSHIDEGNWAESRRRLTNPEGLVALSMPRVLAHETLGIALVDGANTDSTTITIDATFEEVSMVLDDVAGTVPTNGKGGSTSGTGASVDSDGDGVSDEMDVDPYDRNKAFMEYDPARGTYGTLIFEDLWPQLGDYDFNDLVLDYNTQYVVDMKGAVASMTIHFIVRAVGAGYRNGLGFQLDIPPGHVRSVDGQRLNRGYTKRNGNGTEAGQPRAVIIAFEDAYDILPASSGTFANTRRDAPSVGTEAISIRVEFNNPIPRYKIGNAPYNIFLIAAGDRGREIHLPGYEPTALAARHYFGSGDDASNGSRSYAGGSGLPWVMHVPRSFDYPVENTPITTAHRKFRAWAESGGREFPDWYMNKEGYRSPNAIY